MSDSLPSEPLPARGVLVGIDHGVRRIGVAVTDADQTLAMPLETIVAKSPAWTLEQLRRVARDYRAAGWVVGLPVRMAGDEGTQAAKVRNFGEWLQRETGLPLCYWDERLSSAEAEAVLWSRGESPRQTKGRLDGLAAQIILDTYLRGRRTNSIE